MSDSEQMAEVRHNDAARRFETGEGENMAVLEYRRSGSNRIIFTHTGVPPEQEGRGVASALARAALDYARAEKLVAIPACPFVKQYIERHPEYQDLLR